MYILNKCTYCILYISRTLVEGEKKIMAMLINCPIKHVPIKATYNQLLLLNMMHVHVQVEKVQTISLSYVDVSLTILCDMHLLPSHAGSSNEQL